jgi:GT2 family glycosyltransferase
MPKVSVIIPVLNLWEMTAACLRSLADHTNYADDALEVLVVDNGSSDATAEELPPLGRALFKKNFKLLRLPRNMGFAIACNAGAAAATGDLLFFLNNDTRVRPGWLPPLVKILEKPKIGAAGPLLLYPDGRVQHCGIAVSPLLRLWHIYEHFPGNHPLPGKQRRLQAITAAALMLRKEYFFQAGAFFEEYLNGFEDIDLCCALRRKGHDLVIAPQSIIVHYASQTPGRFEADKRNAALLAQRWGEIIRPDLHLLATRDGYRLRLGPKLACWLALPQSREDALNAEFEANRKKSAEFAVEFLEQRLMTEPLWLGGHLRLIETLEAENRGREALAVTLRALDFFPLPQIQMRLTRLARQECLWEDLMPVLDRLAEETNDQSRDFRAVVLTARRNAVNHGDIALARIMEEWLLCYSADNSA